METRETNGKALPSETEMELRGQIEVHIEPPDNDTTAGSKVSYNLTYLVFFLFFKKCAIKRRKRRRKCNLSKEANTIRSFYRSIWILSTLNLHSLHSGQKFHF